MGRKGKRHGARRTPVRSQRLPGLMGTVRLTERSAEIETSEGVYKISHRGLNGAMPGDRAYVNIIRARGGKRVASVVNVVDRAVVSIVGEYRPAGPLGAVRPLDGRIRQDFFVLPEDDSPTRLGARSGGLVVACILQYPSRGDSGVVTLERVIGDTDAPALGVECVMARYGLGEAYPQAAAEEAAELELDVQEALDDPIRRDLRDRFVITIDPVDARDFDDAISLERTDRGGWMLGVHIADVSHYIPWGTALDLAARDRSTSVYLADRVLPMLPESLCNDLCSLRPHEDRLAMTVDIEFDAAGRIRGYTPYPSVIRSSVRTDYAAADELICRGCPVDPAPESVSLRAHEACEAARAHGVDLVAFLREADELAARRRDVRRRRGSIDFNTMEVHALLDERGAPVELTVRDRTAATSLVEEAMLAANECVAEFLSDRDLVAAYRVHEQPSPDSLAAAARTLVEVGALDRELAVGVMAAEPHAIELAVERAAGTPMEQLVNAVLLRAQQRAVYKPHNEGHYALGARAYCHFTSPIRRYPDLVVHRVLKQAIADRVLGKKRAKVYAQHLVGTGPQSLVQLCPHICKHASEEERVADAAARDSQKVKIAQFYASHVGERYAGCISWVSDLGAFVRLDDTQAEGLVRMADLGNEWWDYDEMRLRAVGASTGTVIELGQRVVVEISSVDAVRGRLDFRLVHAGAALH